jgi:hypothetical protein
MKTYRLTAAGRRLTLTLMLAAVLLWIFAVALLRTTLGLQYRHLFTSLSVTLRGGLGVSQLIPAGIMVMLLVAAPLLLWGLWEEWNTSYTVGDDGLIYRTAAGIALHYPWTAIRGLRRGDKDQAVAKLLVLEDSTRQIHNPLLRWLHRQAVGTQYVPIYADIEHRDELLDEIVQRSGLEA